MATSFLCNVISETVAVIACKEKYFFLKPFAKKPPLQNFRRGDTIEFAIFSMAHHPFCRLFGFIGAEIFINILYLPMKIEQRDKVCDAFFHLLVATSLRDPHYKRIYLPLSQKLAHITSGLVTVFAKNRILRKCDFSIDTDGYADAFETDIERCNLDRYSFFVKLYQV